MSMTPYGEERLAAFRADSKAMIVLRWLLKHYDSCDIWSAAIDVELEDEGAEVRTSLPDNVVCLDDYRPA